MTDPFCGVQSMSDGRERLITLSARAAIQEGLQDYGRRLHINQVAILTGFDTTLHEPLYRCECTQSLVFKVHRQAGFTHEFSGK